MSVQEKRSCFVIAPISLKVAPFLEALRREHFEPFFISDFLNFRETPKSGVRAAFRPVDFVIALLYSKYSLENVYFELGISLGLAKPTIVFADHEVRPPSSLRGVNFHYTKLDNLPSLIPLVEDFLLGQRSSKSLPSSSGVAFRSVSREEVLVTSRRELMDAIDSFESDQQTPFEAEEQLQTKLADILKIAGLTVVQAPERGGQSPDLALWIDAVQKEIGNPIALEIKSRITRRSLDETVSQLSKSLHEVGAKAGIILHTGKDSRFLPNICQEKPLIFCFSVEEFLSFLKDDTLASVLKNFRKHIG